ncbi:alpha-N-acetylglucosaminidase [Luteibacter yeojuensis]|uniref:Alpha-N-acetylglucosaminidase n=1 Tax=Luteibacter yeojuensis TaxID=345309 RepID=A0A7X5TRB7_9GAMM|nr:alpha-N-acetylglucosaminidase [Luteibacter yeojuensis]NID16714.1 alpha-N-acetylglucosaminidase [Luteibacter yeojuensis]
MRGVFGPVSCLVTLLWLASPLSAQAQPAVVPTAAAYASFDTTPAHDALVRLIGEAHANQVDLRAVARPRQGDFFRISSQDRRLVIEGTSPATLIAGFGWYLAYVAHANITLAGEQRDIPDTLPLPAKPIVQEANGQNRFALNDVDEGYTEPYASWEYWEHKIDVLALHGINQVLVYQGQEKVYEEAFQTFGYGRDELVRWIPQAAHQPWWLLQNLCCSPEPIAQGVIDRRAELARKMADRLRQLGMMPVFPGFYGTVPPGFAKRNKGAHVVPTGEWDGYQRPDWLDPNDPWFARVAAEFYRAQTALFGESRMYKMDPLHEGIEGGDHGGIDLVAATKGIQAALNRAHPDAIWVLLGWETNPLPPIVEGLDKSHALIVDGESEATLADTDRETEWKDTPYAFGTIWNFGGHTNIGANLSVWNERFWQWKKKPRNAMTGVALMPEASDNNPAALAFFTELAWRKEPANLDEWFRQWAWRRYGGARPDPHAVAAWHILQTSAYDLPATWDSKYQTGYFELAPSLYAHTLPLDYAPDRIEHALAELLQVAPALRNSSAYRHDLTDLTRQALAVRSRVLLPEINAAFEARDKAGFDRLTAQWLHWMQRLDAVLGTNRQFMLGPWLARAKTYAKTPDEWAAINYDARSLITIWGRPDVADYARREWQGLVGDYYYARWKLYFDSLKKALDTGGKAERIDWYAFGETWARGQKAYPTEPSGDIHAMAGQILRELTKDRDARLSQVR